MRKLTKKFRNQFEKLIKKIYKQKIYKPKELWRALKPKGLPSKATSTSNIF